MLRRYAVALKQKAPARLLLRTALAFSLAVLPAMSHAQTSQNSDAAAQTNQEKAHAVLQAMIQAMGGQKWLTLMTTMRRGRTAAFYQGKPTGDISDYVEYQKFPDLTRIEIGKKGKVVEIFDGLQGWEITFRGKRALSSDEVENFARRRDHSVAAAARIWMKDPKTILIYGGQNMVERHLVDQVTLINAQDDAVVIQTDAFTHYPLRRSWQWRDPVYKDKNTDAVEYADYHVIDGIPTAFSITRFHNGDETNQRFLYSAAYNVTLPPGAFDPDKTAARITK